jgi:uncharacterized protein YegJ (DUF2314 family)
MELPRPVYRREPMRRAHPRVALVAAAAAALLALAGCGGGGDGASGTTTGAEPAVVTVADGDTTLAGAREQSQKSWDEFVASFRKERDGFKHDVKLSLATAAGGLESIWVEVTAISGATIRGTLANEPVGDVGLEFGDQVSLQRGQVEDWAVFSKGRVVLGGYSIPESDPTKSGG